MGTVGRQLHARRRRWVLLALPALVLRALIPVGFMPVAAADGFSIELCPDAGPAPLGHAPDAHAHHHHGSAGADPPSAHHHAPCLYAANATLASAPDEAVGLGQRAPERGADAAQSSAPVFIPSILRSQSPRAPPALQSQKK